MLKPIGPVLRTTMWNLGLLALEYTIRADSSAAPATKQRPTPFARSVPELPTINYPPVSPVPVLTVERGSGSARGNRANGTPEMVVNRLSLIRRADRRWLERAMAARQRQQRVS